MDRTDPSSCRLAHSWYHLLKAGNKCNALALSGAGAGAEVVTGPDGRGKLGHCMALSSIAEIRESLSGST